MKSKDSKILSKLIVFLDNSGPEPVSDSPAANEIRSFPRPESMKTAFGMASQSLIAATDYLEALDFLVQKEEFAIAPWSCARGMVESSALCSWWALPPESVSAEVYLLDMSHSVNNKKWQDMMVIP